MNIYNLWCLEDECPNHKVPYFEYSSEEEDQGKVSKACDDGEITCPVCGGQVKLCGRKLFGYIKRMSPDEVKSHFKERSHKHYKEAIEPEKEKIIKKEMGGE